MLQCCVSLLPAVCLSVCDVCIVAKRCVLEKKLLLTAYRNVVCQELVPFSKMNNLDLYLEVVLRSRQPLRYVHR